MFACLVSRSRAIHCAVQNHGNSSMVIRNGVGVGALLFARANLGPAVELAAA